MSEVSRCGELEDEAEAEEDVNVTNNTGDIEDVNATNNTGDIEDVNATNNTGDIEDVNATNNTGDRSLEVSVAEFQSLFSFCKSTKNYQNALDLNQTYWEKISIQTARDRAINCQTKLFDRDGNEINLVTTFGEYIVKKSEVLCEIGRMDEAREMCLRALKDLEEKIICLRNGFEIKLSRTEDKSDLAIVTESLYVCMSTISVREFDLEKAFEILDRNVLEGLEVRLDALNNHHNTLKQLMTKTNAIAMESLEEDFNNTKIIVGPFLEDHYYLEENGKFYVQSLDQALRIAKNGDSIFLRNLGHAGHVGKDGKMRLEKNVTVIGESTKESYVFVPTHKRTMGEIHFKRLNIWIGSPIHVSQGKISFENCLVDGCCDSFFTIDNQQAEIDLRLCSFTSAGNSSLVQLKNSDSTIKMKFKNCSFADFKFIITDFRETSLRCGFELHMESCSFLGIKLAMIALQNFNPSQEEINSQFSGYIKPSFSLTYPTSVVIRNCSVEVCSSTEDVSHIMDIDNACHVLIETTKFSAKRGKPAEIGRVKHMNVLPTGLRFANIQRLEISNVIVIREGIYSTLTCLRTYLENYQKVGSIDDAAVQLSVVHEAIIRDSIFNGFYCGITTKSIVQDVILNNKVQKNCFTGVYSCQLSNMAVCVLPCSGYTNRSIFVLSDILLQDSLVGVSVSDSFCVNGRPGSVDVLYTKFINIASPIVVPKVLIKDGSADAKNEKKNLLSRLETKNLAFQDSGSQNVSRKKRKDNVIKNLMKGGVLDSTTSIPYLEKIFNPGGYYLEIADEKDLEAFNSEDSWPQSTSDYQSDYDDTVD